MPRENRKRKGKVVPYVSGFRRPSRSQQIRAIGFAEGATPAAFKLHPRHFPPIRKCISRDDWLAQYKEDGQTYDEFLHQCPWLSSRKRRNIQQKFVSSGTSLPEKYPDGKIYVVALIDPSTQIDLEVDAFVEYLHLFYDLPVKQMPPAEITLDRGSLYWVRGDERHKLNSRRDGDTGRVQLCVDTNLLLLKKILPPDGLCMIALTMTDLYESPPDLFVAGMAAGNHRVAIFSLYRYDPNLAFSCADWFDVDLTNCFDEEERKKLLLQRGCRLVAHEVAHLLGVDHCTYFSCCMNGSGHLEEDFRQPMFVCPVDLRKLQTLCGFDPVARYRKLQEFYRKHGLIDEVMWIENRLHTVLPEQACIQLK